MAPDITGALIVISPVPITHHVQPPAQVLIDSATGFTEPLQTDGERIVKSYNPGSIAQLLYDRILLAIHMVDPVLLSPNRESS